MTGIARRLVAAAVACATSLVLVMGAVPGVVRAETGTAYSATATAYYRNPATGQIEDQGGEGSGAIGSSTATSLLDGSALVEAGQSGARYVTLRLKQASELSDVRVDYDRSWTNAYTSLMPQQTGAADDWADYQVQVPDETGAFRITANVASLGRDVTFFAALSNFVPGIPAGFTRATTDPTASQAAPAVVASPSVPALAEGVAETAMPATDASQATTGEAAGSASVGSADGSGVSTAQPQGSAVSSSPTVIVLPIQQHQPVTAAPATTEAAAEEAQGVATTDGAREYDVEGNEVGAGAPVAAGGVVVPLAALVVGGVVVVAVAGGLVWLLGFYRPRRLQRERDAVAALDGALPPTSAVLPDDPEDDEAPAHYVPSPYEVPAAEGVPGGTGADQTPDPDAAVTQIVLDATTQLPNPVAAPGQKGEAEQGEAEGDAAPGATDGGREA